MKSGYHIIDVDTHVTPSYEVLMSYADEALRARADELTPYVRITTPAPGRGHPETEYGQLRINPRTYPRVAGQNDSGLTFDAVNETASAPGFKAQWCVNGCLNETLLAHTAGD